MMNMTLSKTKVCIACKENMALARHKQCPDCAQAAEEFREWLEQRFAKGRNR